MAELLREIEKFQMGSYSSTARRNLLIRQANVITSAKTDLTRDQRRIVHQLLVRIAKTHQWPDGGVLEIDYRDFSQAYGINPQEARDDLRRAITDFRMKFISYTQKYDVTDSWALGETSDVELAWTTKREKINHKGKYRITFNPELRDLLMPLVANENGANISFTILEYSDTLKLKQKYSLQLYESLCQYRSTGLFRVSLDKLISRWSIPKSYHKKFSDLKTKILEKALEEVCRETRFRQVTFEEHRDASGKVTSVEFRFPPVAI